MKHVSGLKPLSRKDFSVISKYREVLSYVQSCGLYKDEALTLWSQNDVADPWLIAAALSKDAVIVTMESSSGPISKQNKSRNAKIPNVADHFGVHCKSLFEFMQDMKIVL